MNPSHSKVRNIMYILGMCIYLSLFFPYFNSQLQEFAYRLEDAGQPALSLFQYIIFSCIAAAWQFIIAFAISGFITYYFNKLSIFVYILFPLLLRTITVTVVLYITGAT